jgi:multidrug efflux pump
MRAYGAMLSVTIRLRWVAALVAIAIGGSAYWFFVNLPKELTPTEDQGVFYISVEGPQGSTLEYTAEQVAKVEALLEPYWGPGGVGDNSQGGPLDRVITILSPGWGGASGVNTARIIARTLPWGERTVSPIQIVNELSPKLAAIPGVRASAFLPAGLGVRGGGEPIQFAVGGPDFETARVWADTVVAEVEGDPMFRDLRADFEATTPQLAVQIDRERAIDVGVDVAAIGRALQTFLGGREVTEFFDRGELYRVLLQADPSNRSSPNDLSDIYVRSGTTEQLIPLSSVVTLEERGTVRELRRVNRVPSVVITGSVGEGYALGAALDRLERAVEERLPPGAMVNYLGESLEYRDSSLQLYITFGMALVLVYLALAAQFESVIHPITIMVSVPLAVTGGLAALWFTGESLNLYSQIGLILLIGLMAKNGILMVEFANQLSRQGKSPREAAMEAAMVRLRPILMTAISTILGALALVFAIGAGAEGRRAIGEVIVGGMGFATLLTLFVIPALYVLLAPLTRSGDPVEARFDRQMADHESRRVGVNGAHAGFNGSGGHGASRPRVPTLPRAEA